MDTGTLIHWNKTISGGFPPMKNTNKIHVLLFFLLVFSALFSAAGLCQEMGGKKLVITPDMLWEYAHILMDKEDYTAAQIELKRFVHFFPTDERIALAKIDTAKCLFHGGQYLASARICNEIMLDMSESPTPESLEEQACFLQSLCFEKMGNIGHAKLVLHNYLTLIHDGSARSKKSRDKAYFHLGRLYLGQGAKTASLEEIKKAEEFFAGISPAGMKKYHVSQYLAAIARGKKFPLKNPGLGGALALVPGAGFLYTHRFHDALASLAVNGGLALAAHKAWDQDNKALAGVLALVGTGFYTGNIYGSITAVHKYNRNGMFDLINGQVALTPVVGKDGYGVMLEMPFSLPGK